MGSYIGGVYYPDKTKVGWWKIGYPDFFAKVLNSPNWIGIELNINDQDFDLNKCSRIEKFKRVLDLKKGFYLRSLEAVLKDKTKSTAKKFKSKVYGVTDLLKTKIDQEDNDYDEKIYARRTCT